MLEALSAAHIPQLRKLHLPPAHYSHPEVMDRALSFFEAHPHIEVLCWKDTSRTRAPFKIASHLLPNLKEVSGYMNILPAFLSLADGANPNRPLERIKLFQITVPTVELLVKGKDNIPSLRCLEYQAGLNGRKWWPQLAELGQAYPNLLAIGHHGGTLATVVRIQAHLTSGRTKLTRVPDFRTNSLNTTFSPTSLPSASSSMASYP